MSKYFLKYLQADILKSVYIKAPVRKFNSCVTLIPNLKIRNCRPLHLSKVVYVKLFEDRENAFANKILQSFPIIKNVADIKVEINKPITNEDEFESFLNQDWRSATAGDITRAFLNVLSYCQENDINISDNRFDKLIDGLMDNVEKLTTGELYSLLECLTELPPTQKYTDHNFHDVWSALDDACCWKMKNWDTETLFKFANLWYLLNLGRLCDYVHEFIDKLSRKPGKLKQKQLVHMFFYINICRKKSIEFEFESAISNKLESLTLDEMAIIAMGFFKTQTKIKLESILNRMIELVIQDADNAHEISLAAILKVVRMSKHPQTATNIIKMLDKLTPQIPRLSHICSMHAALVGTTLQIIHEPILKAVAQKVIDNISDIEKVRLKDIERLLLATTMFDYDPETTPDFYKTSFEELHRDERLPERVRYPKCIPCALTFLSIRNIYSEKLMDVVLNPDFTREVYGKGSKLLPRELFALDLSREIDFPDYKGSKWTAVMRQKASKWLVEYLPDSSKKNVSLSEKLIFDVINIVCKITGDKKYLFIGYVLPQYAKPDIIICLDKTTNKFVEPTGLQNHTLGEIIRPHDLEKYKWYAIVPVSFSLTTRNTFELMGNGKMKKRHLETIGYEPILVKWNEYSALRDEEKIDYVLNKMKQL